MRTLQCTRVLLALHVAKTRNQKSSTTCHQKPAASALITSTAHFRSGGVLSCGRLARSKRTRGSERVPHGTIRPRGWAQALRCSWTLIAPHPPLPASRPKHLCPRHN